MISVRSFSSLLFVLVWWFLHSFICCFEFQGTIYDYPCRAL